MSNGRSSYAGDISAEDAFALLKDKQEAVLVDVRTHAEWSYVGIPDLSDLGKVPVLLQWQSYPDGAVLSDFVGQLAAQITEGSDFETQSGTPLLFLCRSGVRSQAAAMAMTAAGFTDCINIENGFEGHHDAHGHRGVVDGWKAAGLPWRQG